MISRTGMTLDSRFGRHAVPVLLLGAAGIAFAPIFVRLSEIGPVATALWRVGLALPVLWLLAGRQTGGIGRRIKPSSARDVALLLLAGLFFAGDLAAWHIALSYTTVANATLLANLAPVFVTIFSWVLFGERFGVRFLVGLVLAMFGSALLISNSLRFSMDNFFGDLLGVLTAVFYAAYLLAISRLRHRFTVQAIMAWAAIGTVIGVLPLVAIRGEIWIAATGQGWLVLIGLALVSHVFGQGAIAFALAHLPAAFSSVSLLVQPLLAALFAWVIFGEALGVVQGLGAVVILVGVRLAHLAVIADRAPPLRV